MRYAVDGESWTGARREGDRRTQVPDIERTRLRERWLLPAPTMNHSLFEFLLLSKNRITAPRARRVSMVLALATAACGGASADAGSGSNAVVSGQRPFPTLDGKQPMIVGHRGLPGRSPEETQLSYDMAADAGADALEEDLHLSKDCVLVARHNPWLSDNTNIAELARFSDRKRTVKGVITTTGSLSYLTDRTSDDPRSVLKSLVVDGEEHVGDWAISDFTAAELATIGGTTYDAKDERPTEFNGRFPVLTFQQIVEIAKAKTAEKKRMILVYPELKNPTWNNAQAKANGCPGERPLEDAFLAALGRYGLNSADAPIIVQSFEPSTLKYLRQHGLKARQIQLIDASGVDSKTGRVLYDGISSGRPYDWTIAGDPRTFEAMLTAEGLKEITSYAELIGPWKPQIIPVVDNRAATTPTNLIASAHRAGLAVHVFTFRNEKRYLAANYTSAIDEYLNFFRAGVDGVFTDFADTGVQARSAYVAELGRSD